MNYVQRIVVIADALSLENVCQNKIWMICSKQRLFHSHEDVVFKRPLSSLDPVVPGLIVVYLIIHN